MNIRWVDRSAIGIWSPTILGYIGVPKSSLSPNRREYIRP